MSVELQQGTPIVGDMVNTDLKQQVQGLQINSQMNPQEKTQQHPLHQFDLTVMGKFYESCVSKLKEQNPKWNPTEWKNSNPMPGHLSWEQKYEWANPLVISHKQRVYEAFARLARESGEPMILMPNFDYGDIINFEKFLQALKQDGVNAIGKYKQYLNNKDMRKFEIDLVVLHPRYGVLLFEVKDCDHMDNKRRSRARLQLTNARSCFESMARLIFEAKGWTQSEASLPITEFIALPNVCERPENKQQQGHLQTPGGNQNHSASSTTSSSSGRSSRTLNYLIKSDMENPTEFGKWWSKWVVEPKNQQFQQAESDKKVNKYDVNTMNWIMGLINCIRNNSIMPVVYPENGCLFDVTLEQPAQQPEPHHQPEQPEKQENGEQKSQEELEKEKKEMPQFQAALNVYGEFFQAEHESVRALSKVVVASADAEKMRKTICLQTLWLLLNDSQKKISVVCSDVNKPYYEEFFARQRKLYNNLNNVRFYTDLQSCVVNAQHTIKRDGEIWFFDSGIKGTFGDIMERVKELNAFWIFSTQENVLEQYKNEWDSMNVRCVKLNDRKPSEQECESMPWLSNTMLKFPMRLHCDLLIIGDIVGSTQMKLLYKFLKNNVVTNQSSSYQNNGEHSGHRHYNNHQQQQLNFNPSKKFKTVKFIRGGTIDNLRNSLKMHDSIQAQCILMHIGDEDLFKTHNSVKTVERIKEMATLVKEYCPKSFVVLSTLMRRMSRTENGVASDVNKGMINFCKQTRDTLNCYYMLNNHFEPDYHTQEGRILSNKGLKLYIDNLLFVVDYFLIRNNKQQ